MNKIKFILGGLFVVIVVAALGYQYYRGADRQPATQTENNLNTQDNQTAEDLIKQSALEMTDPGTSTTPKNNNSNSSPSDICVQQAVQTYSCYEDYYKALVAKKGVKAAFDDLKIRYDQNAYIKSQCHPITHTIGNAAVLLYPDVGSAYAQGDSYCWSGYYHGVMEGLIGKISSADLAQKINDVCASIPGKSSYSFDYYNCVHGIGHGIMAITQNELFDSLKACDGLSGSWEQSSCHGGVFMENVIVDNKNHFTKYLKPSEPLYPCTAVNDKYKGTCYLMQTSYMLKVTNGDFSKVFELCSTVGNYSSTCYQSLGRDASGRTISDVGGTTASCNLGKDVTQRMNCYVGAVKDFVSYYHSDVQAKQLCAAIETEIQKVCYDTIESYYKSF